MKIPGFLFTISIIIIILLPATAFAVAYSYGEENTIIGSVQKYTVKDHESLIEIARKFDLGYNEIVDTNPDLDPFVPGKGKLIEIPTSWILPDVISYEGIVINLSEMRLFCFFKQRYSRLVMTFPIGIGKEGYNTPLGSFSIVEKIVDPSWHVPESIQKEKLQLPEVVPPGPDNPLGSHAIRLSLGNTLIHGTNKPWGVGRRVSHGCIRLYPEDISKLFELVRNGTKVTIVRQPVKIGKRGSKVFIEVNNEVDGKNVNYFDKALDLLRKKNLVKAISTEKLYKALRDKKGIPVDISNQ